MISKMAKPILHGLLIVFLTSAIALADQTLEVKGSTNIKLRDFGSVYNPDTKELYVYWETDGEIYTTIFKPNKKKTSYSQKIVIKISAGEGKVLRRPNAIYNPDKKGYLLVCDDLDYTLPDSEDTPSGAGNRSFMKPSSTTSSVYLYKMNKRGKVKKKITVLVKPTKYNFSSFLMYSDKDQHEVDTDRYPFVVIYTKIGDAEKVTPGDGTWMISCTAKGKAGKGKFVYNPTRVKIVSPAPPIDVFHDLESWGFAHDLAAMGVSTLGTTYDEDGNVKWQIVLRQKTHVIDGVTIDSTLRRVDFDRLFTEDVLEVWMTYGAYFNPLTWKHVFRGFALVRCCHGLTYVQEFYIIYDQKKDEITFHHGDAFIGHTVADVSKYPYTGVRAAELAETPFSSPTDDEERFNWAVVKLESNELYLAKYDEKREFVGKNKLSFVGNKILKMRMNYSDTTGFLLCKDSVGTTNKKLMLRIIDLKKYNK